MKIAIVVLAAGQSNRFGKENKLVAEIDGVPLVRRVVSEALASTADDVVVVTGWEAPSVCRSLDGLNCRVVFNEDFANGMGDSIAEGIAALADDVMGAMVLPGDLAYVGHDVLDKIIKTFAEHGGNAVTIPVTADGGQRNPVVWPKSMFPKLMNLRGDRGGKALLYTGATPPVVLQIDDGNVFLDIDTPDRLKVSKLGSEPE